MKLTKNNFSTFKIAGLTMILLVVFSQLNAQESKAGIKGGLNLSLLSIDDASENNLLPGFHAGVWGKLMVNDHFGIQPEILFTTKGVKTVYDEEFAGNDIADGETKLNINYIDIPLYLVFNLSETFEVHFGPYLGVLMNATLDTQAEILEFIEVDDVEDIDRSEFNNLDYGLSGGFGINVDPMYFGVSYDMGLHQVAKSDQSSEKLLGDATNHSLMFFVGIAF